MRLTLAPPVLDQILAHLKAGYPHEGCGFVVGRNGVGERFIAMRNAAASSQRYSMDPAEIIHALRALRENGEELIAICHSHPFAPAVPSASDVEAALYPQAFHIIVSLQDLERPAIRAFSIRDGRVWEAELSAMV